jgi:hypothetical protein
MRQISFYIAFVLCLFFFNACKDELIEADKLPELIKFEDKNLEVSPGNYALLDLDKNFPTGGTAIITVKNANILQGKIMLTSDGYLVYQAPITLGEEIILLEITPDGGTPAVEAKVKMSITNQPTGTSNCYRNLDVFVVPAIGSVTITPNMLTRNDTTCGNVPSGDIEFLFMPNELPYTINGDDITVSPLQGGIDLDVMVYKGNYTNQDSAYFGIVFLTNQAGCFPWPINDVFEVTASPDSSYYTLNVLANDYLCDYPRDSVDVEPFFSGAAQGTFEVTSNEDIRYFPPANATYPLQVNFNYVFTIRKRSGMASTYTSVGLKINP